MSHPPLVSVCIPAYNRPAELGQLLESITSQAFADCEVVVCEDCSPERLQIQAMVEAHRSGTEIPIRYFENDQNLGYDGNLRMLVARAQGEYCLFMGNDDLMCPGALESVADGVQRHSNIGVILRSYDSFLDDPKNVVQSYKYFDSERVFPPCPESVVTFFRRSVVISGMVVHRQSALNYATDAVDGSLLYQLYLVGNILLDKSGLYLPQPLALYRLGGTPDFGNSAVEKDKYVPNQQTPASSVSFVRGMLDVARRIEDSRGVTVYHQISKDLGNYSYPLLRIQSEQPLATFLKYAWDLSKLGLWKNRMFYLYFLSLLLIGPRLADSLINYVKRRHGSTPLLGNIYQGKAS